jgi:hypothetical protein
MLTIDVHDTPLGRWTALGTDSGLLQLSFTPYTRDSEHPILDFSEQSSSIRYMDGPISCVKFFQDVRPASEAIILTSKGTSPCLFFYPLFSTDD